MPKTSEAQIRASVAYNRKKDSITIRPSKEEGTRIRAAAAEAGLSVQAFILGVLRQHIGQPQDEEDGETGKKI
ncbi:MAG: hypothetical protein ACI4EA_08405 [Candidatus Ornithomonoglobus sp.]